THGFFVEQRPVLEDLPRRPVTALPARGPLLAVKGDARRCPVQHICQALRAPLPPLRRTPLIALQCLLPQGVAVGAVAPAVEVPAAQRGRRGAEPRREAMVEFEPTRSD